ncbi:MAG TPA: MFS transporter [Streptosporangiaceae bacterium]|nr:MFS transporter [Streptosporangiaceae bacterium]
MRTPTSPIRPEPAGPPPAGAQPTAEQPTAEQSTAEQPTAEQPTAQPQRILLLVLSATMLIDALEVSIVVVALPSIAGGLRIPMPAAQWLMSGFALGFGGMLLFGGRVVDRLGQRRVYLAALLAYAAMCIVSGLSPDAGVLIASRVARGCCAALTAPTGLAIIARTFPEGSARNRALAIYAAFGASGFTAGLLLSGLLTQLDWRWTLMFPAPVALVLVAVGWRVIPRTQPGPARRYDVGGAVTLARAAALLPLRPLAHGTLTRAGLAAAALNGSYWGLLFIATFRLQDGLGWQPLPTALAFLPASVPPMLAAPFARSLVRRLGARRLVVAGLLAATAGYAVALVRPPVAYAGELLPVLLLVGLGYVGAFSGLHMHALSGVPADAARTATGVYQSLVQIGGALVLAVVAALNASYPGYRPAFAVLTAVSVFGVAAVLVSRPDRSHSHREGMRSNDRGSRREVGLR